MKIAITHGDPNGVGYETIYKAFAGTALAELATPIVYGSADLLSQCGDPEAADAPVINVIATPDDAEEGVVNVIDCLSPGLAAKRTVGMRTTDGGRAAMEALKLATAHLKAGLVDALVTAPVDKGAVQAALQPERFTGHTEWLEKELRPEGSDMRALMLMVSQEKGMRVALATNHVAVREVAEVITKPLITGKLKALDKSLREDFGIDAPRIAVLSLNPHSGDNGLMGNEEQELIIPAIEEVRKDGVLAFGPYSADGFWGTGNWRRFDGVLAMYHDQGLIPFKALAMDSGVNYTAGLPYVRTSPDHGTAYDIAGKGLARPDSLRAAIYAAIDIVRNRAIHAEATANPLTPRQLPDRGRPKRDQQKAASANANPQPAEAE